VSPRKSTPEETPTPPEPTEAAKEDPLALYRAKRSGSGTPEPIGSSSPVSAGRTGVFVVHEHSATRHHWDLRLEIDGVLCSWAVPKAPSMDPDDKRLAVKVENHPKEYIDFEAVIPPGNYGAGPMIVWDRGLFLPVGDPAQGMRDGEIKFELRGYKLRGAFTLVHTGKGRRGRFSGSGSDDWLLIKKRDAWTDAWKATGEPLSAASILSGLTIEELRDGADRVTALRAEIAGLGLPKKAINPVGFQPMLCHTADAPFSSPDWIFELKYDGYRMVAFGGAGQAELRYRSNQVATARFPEIAAAVRAIPCPNVVLDGEVVVTDADGKPVFNLLQQRSQIARASEIQRAAAALPATYFVFDLLGLDGWDLRGLPLLLRKELARRIVPEVGPMRWADHIDELGELFLDAVVQRGLEGVVAKKKTAPYQAKRSKDWLKLKVDPDDDFAVCGYTPPKSSRIGLGALYLTMRDGDKWVFAGKVGSGFDDATLAELKKELDAEPAWKPPFPLPERIAGARWIAPRRVATVRYREWIESDTGSGTHVPRFPVFLHFREDKTPEECVVPPSYYAARKAHAGEERDGEDIDEDEHAELEEDGPTPAPIILDDDTGPIDRAALEPEIEVDHVPREIKLSNQKKVFWPDEGITKGDLVDYYKSIAPWILPYMADRPCVITRYPDGIAGKWFYQKDMPEWVPPWLRTFKSFSEHSQREIHYVLVDDEDGLAFLANLGSIPMHVWASRATAEGTPDWTIIDLDPKNAPREHVVPLALAIHELCESLGLPSYVKTSGQTGLHVLIPLGQQCTFDQARDLAYLLAMIVERRHPTMATTHRNPAARGGRVYLDWGQNARGQLLVAPFSVRPQPGAPVSMPLRWDEVTPALDPKEFHLRNARARMEALGDDPVRHVLAERPDLVKALERLSTLAGIGE
jgi:bifunctional non-homologous end joining protein LigD